MNATGSAGTQAGLVAGFAGLNSGIPVLGMSGTVKREHVVAQYRAEVSYSLRRWGRAGVGSAPEEALFPAFMSQPKP